MGTLNLVMLMGNLTRNPDLRKTQTGLAVADLGLAVNERYKTQAGEEVKKTCFVDVTVWGKQAETCAQYLRKGSPVLVEGKLQYDQWETPEGGRRSKLRVIAERVRFLSGGGEREAEAADEDQPEARTAPAGRSQPASRRPAGREARGT